ncbi:hypothetical protein [Glaciihabitans sp. dw_435]|uniref:hypothetical protein n=1 Tax=Glaciihabitans sp. dw_435 TaxID=2720081 RepID=UPI001BD2C5A6|nr:hypothetical protein [Glaciihabitans sp. dw_435]
MSITSRLTTDENGTEKVTALQRLRDARTALRENEASYRSAKIGLDDAYKQARKAGWADGDLSEFG